ncbi:MAG: hypothetical protein KDD70_19360, partial [Bdellovibrionales bacterium]|nr:hypothetical protein [Bdellovibrionales bacterium]
TIYPEVGDFKRLFEGAFFEGKTVSFIEHNDVLFRSVPSETEVKKACAQYFEANYSVDYIEKIQKMIASFLTKGKSITFADFQDIIQDALESLKSEAPAVFHVLDFEVTTGKDKKAKASVTVQLRDAEHTASGEGVGPVDAVISALRKACSEQIDFSLSNYKVDIRDQGTD